MDNKGKIRKPPRAPQESTEFSLAQLARDIADLGPSQHGFSYLAPDFAQLTPRGHGRLSGWVISAKDLSDVAGMPTTLGSAARTHVASETESYLEELESEGALIVGKSATPELGLYIDTEPTGLPAVDNPLWPGHTPGGSSGGAAVQVARGLLRAAHAGDGGGSIRVPAAACGVVGFKPAGTNLGVSGFITRTVADAAFLHGHTPLPAQTSLSSNIAESGPLKVGVLTQPLFIQTDVAPVMLQAVEEARQELASAGYETMDLEVPEDLMRETFAAFRAIFSAHVAELEDAEGYVAWIKELGRTVSPEQLQAALDFAAALPDKLAKQWHVDAILTPTLAYDPPVAGTFKTLREAGKYQECFDEQTRWSPWCSLFNVARLPAISIPWELSGRPPVGVQLGSITLSEPELLALATELHP